ncbi:MAG: rhamnulokinase [Acidobacteriia bacterium]|nr:rhamnulokinase [Terriglobia bacterium]
MGRYLAFDLGAESGRAIAGRLEDGRLAVEELHRFPNTPIEDGPALYWDTPRLWREIQQGIAVAAGDRRLALDGIGIDTWGVDFGLLSGEGTLLENPRHYRDPRTAGVMEKLFATVPREQVFGYTGIQFMQLNTLYQLYAMKLEHSPALGAAHRLLNMPDLFNYRLTGAAKSEATIASTTQFFNPGAMAWATELFDRLGLPGGILCPIVAPGTLLGTMIDPPNLPVYATAGHDTAAAVAAVPAEGGAPWCYISSGTWSLMGIELHRPVIDRQSLALNFTNEVGAGGRIRLLKNIPGLWLLQECRGAWRAEGADYTYDELAGMAAAARPFAAAIDSDAFLAPGDMPRRIAEHCRQTDQEPPQTRGECVRAILESLALRYRSVLESLEALGGRRIEVIHIVGGGSRNALLNQFAADATGRPVVAGPSEATAIGNILVQALGAGEIAGLEELRSVVRRSFAPVTFQPRPSAQWDAAYERFRKLFAQ